MLQHREKTSSLRFWYVSNRDRWSGQCRSSSSGRSASNAAFFGAVLMSCASVCRWPFRASSSLRVTPHQVLKPLHCSLHLSQLGTSRREDLSEQSSCSSRRQPIVCADAARLLALHPIQSSQGCRTTSALCTAALPIFTECPEASRLESLRSLPSPLPTLFPRPTSRRISLQDVRSRRSSLCVVPKTRIHFPCSSVAEAYQGLSCPPRLDWLVLDSWRLPLPRRLSAQGIVASLSRLGRGLAVELAAVASATTPGVPADSESSAQSAAQRVVLDPSARSLSSKVTAARSDSSLELTS